MKHMKIMCMSVLAVLPAAAVAYDSAFTLSFEEVTDSEGWSDPIGGNTLFVTGENTPADNPAYATPPNAATGYNGTDWLRTGADVQLNGVSVVAYDGRAGGASTTVLDFVATVDVYINPVYGDRYLVGLFGRGNAEFSPPQMFYSRNTPSLPDGYGWRGAGITTSYDGFEAGAETTAKWVRLKMTMIGSTATFEVDRDLDGTYELNSGPIALAAAAQDAGQIGVTSVINTSAGARIADQFAYWDNLTYSPVPASVNDWSMY